MRFQFEVRHHGNADKLGLAAMLHEFADDEWLPVHMTAEQATHAVLDRFSRIVRAELESNQPTATRVRNSPLAPHLLVTLRAVGCIDRGEFV